MSLFLKLLALTLALSVISEGADHWCYESQKSSSCPGPESWPGSCKNKEQSPIDIVNKNIKLNRSLTEFTFTDYDKKEERTIVNNGHTVSVKLKNSIKISGGGLSGTYKATGFHFHWSNSLDKGSEHTIDGKTYAMEMHIVHIKDKFEDESKALASPDRDAVAVLGFLIEASKEKHEGFETILAALDKISHKNDETTTKPMSLNDLILDPKNRKSYFRYMGSLTTPNCDEKVIWTVFKNPIRIQGDQILQFSKKLFYNEKAGKSQNHNVSMTALEKNMTNTAQTTVAPTTVAPIKDMPIIDNYRPIQKKDDSRVVFHSGVQGLLPHTWPTFLAPLLTYLLAVLIY